jgi:hypothetical protein
VRGPERLLAGGAAAGGWSGPERLLAAAGGCWRLLAAAGGCWRAGCTTETIGTSRNLSVFHLTRFSGRVVLSVRG